MVVETDRSGSIAQYVDIKRRLYPTGINPRQVRPREACKLLETLDEIERKKKYQVGVCDFADTPEGMREEKRKKRDEELLSSVRDLKRYPKCIKQKPHHHFKKQ